MDMSNGDYRISAGSPCIDAGLPADLRAGLDGSGYPRLLDGHLDGMLRIDIGANEFGHGFLEAPAAGTPGTSIPIHVDGTAGLFCVVFLGLPSEGTVVDPYGSLFVDRLSGVRLLGAGPLPFDVQWDVPVPFPPTELTVQAVVRDLGSGHGNVSNSCRIAIE